MARLNESTAPVEPIEIRESKNINFLFYLNIALCRNIQDSNRRACSS